MPRRRLVLVGLALGALACSARGGGEAPAVEPRAAEPTAVEPAAVFAEVESLPRAAVTPTEAERDGPGVELDWAAVDPSLSGLVSQPRVRVDYDADHPWIGADQPLVTAVVFADYQCPYCANADVELRAVVDAHPDEVRVVVRMMPLAMHSHARGAALAALAAHEQGQFEAMHELLFGNPGALARPELERYAAGLGLDLPQFRADMDSEALAQRLVADRALADAVGVVGVPTIFVNGRELDDPAAFDRLVAEELGLAAAMIDAGAPRTEVWARIMAASEAP